MTSVRPVWLTREQRDRLDALAAYLDARGIEPQAVLSDLRDAWDAAPADATEAATKAAKPWDTAIMGDGTRSAFYLEDAEIAANVLRALGMPDPQPEAT